MIAQYKQGIMNVANQGIKVEITCEQNITNLKFLAFDGNATKIKSKLSKVYYTVFWEDTIYLKDANNFDYCNQTLFCILDGILFANGKELIVLPKYKHVECKYYSADKKIFTACKSENDSERILFLISKKGKIIIFDNFNCDKQSIFGNDKRMYKFSDPDLTSIDNNLFSGINNYGMWSYKTRHMFTYNKITIGKKIFDPLYHFCLIIYLLRVKWQLPVEITELVREYL